MLRIVGKLFILLLCLAEGLSAGRFEFPELVADTVRVELAADSLCQPYSTSLVIDRRRETGPFLTIDTRKKLHYIPVDQFYLLNYPLADVVGCYCDSLIAASPAQQLVIENITFWTARTTFGWENRLEGYSSLRGTDGRILKDWQWQVTVPREKKEAPDLTIGRLTKAWLDGQTTALQSNEPDFWILPRPYRRQLQFVLDLIVTPNGLIGIGHCLLEFPRDEQIVTSYSSPGLYYRRTKQVESVALGGYDFQVHRRKNGNWLWRYGWTGRLGYNSISIDRSETIGWWNLFMLQVATNVGLQYQPRYHQGLYGGIGLYLQINALPELVDLVEPGIMFNLGVLLP